MFTQIEMAWFLPPMHGIIVVLKVLETTFKGLLYTMGQNEWGGGRGKTWGGGSYFDPK